LFAVQTPLIISMPKSATQFVTRAVAQSLGGEVRRVSTALPFAAQIDPEQLWALRGTYDVGRSYAPATPFNVAMIREAGFRRFVLLVRDPRDALLSWWYHNDRSLHRENQWSLAMDVADGLRSREYLSSSREEQLQQLANLIYPAFIKWLTGWATTLRENCPEVMVLRFEDFRDDPRGHILRIIEHFGYDVPVILPERGSQPINDLTNRRKGSVGDHRIELPAAVVNQINAGSPRWLFDRFAWPLESANPTDRSPYMTTDANGRLSALEDSPAERTRRLEALESTIEERSVRLAALERSMEERSARLAALERSMEERNARLTALEHTMEERTHRILTLEANVKGPLLYRASSAIRRLIRG
jgi:Sulfotransferase domain